MDDLKLYGKNEKQAGSLVNTVQIFSKGIGMAFGIMKWGNVFSCQGIVLTDGQTIKGLEEGD